MQQAKEDVTHDSHRRIDGQHYYVGVRANIHLGGQTEFCPNGEHNLFVTRPRQRDKNNNELLQCLFLTVVDCRPTR